MVDSAAVSRGRAMRVKKTDLQLPEDTFEPRCIYHADELAAMVPEERLTGLGDICCGIATLAGHARNRIVQASTTKS